MHPNEVDLSDEKVFSELRDKAHFLFLDGKNTNYINALYAQARRQGVEIPK